MNLRFALVFLSPNSGLAPYFFPCSLVDPGHMNTFLGYCFFIRLFSIFSFSFCEMWRPCDGKKVIQKRSICAHHKCDSVRMSCVASQRAKGKEKNHSIVNPLSVGVVSDSSRTTIRSVVLRWWYMNVFTKLSNHFMRMIYVQHCCQRTLRTTHYTEQERREKSSLTPSANEIVTV